MPSNYLGFPRSSLDLRILPPEKIEEIKEAAKKPENQHGSYCKCPENFACPGEGKYNYREISRKTKVALATVQAYLDPKIRERNNGYTEKYLGSRKGQKTTERYIGSTKRKNAQKRHAQRKKPWRKYDKSPLGRENTAKWSFIRSSSLMPVHMNLNILGGRKRAYIELFNEEFHADIEI